MKYFIDTNVIIDFLKKDVDATKKLTLIAGEEDSELFINRLVYLESLRTIDIQKFTIFSWQTKILTVLREFFPKTTFFVSTHSPLVLAGLKNGEGYELYRDGENVKAKAIDNIESFFLNDIVKEFFGVDLNEEKLQKSDKARQKKAKNMLIDLAKTLQENE